MQVEEGHVQLDTLVSRYRASRFREPVQAAAPALLLAAVAAAIYGAHWAVSAGSGKTPSSGEETAAIAAAPEIFRPATTPVPSSSVEPARAQADPVSLASALQRELKRAGCYGGRINGTWSAETRRAMGDFTARVNAVLPLDAPDPVLLALIEAHRDASCTAPDVATVAGLGPTGALPKVVAPPTTLARVEAAPAPAAVAETVEEAPAAVADRPGPRRERKAYRTKRSYNSSKSVSPAMSKGMRNLERALKSLFR